MCLLYVAVLRVWYNSKYNNTSGYTAVWIAIYTMCHTCFQKWSGCVSHFFLHDLCSEGFAARHLFESGNFFTAPWNTISAGFFFSFPSYEKSLRYRTQFYCWQNTFRKATRTHKVKLFEITTIIINAHFCSVFEQHYSFVHINHNMSICQMIVQSLRG